MKPGYVCFIRELQIDLLTLGLCVLFCSMCYVNADDQDGVRRVIRVLQSSAESPDTSPTAIGAARFLRAQDARVLVPLLNAMKSQPLPVVNWLRSVFDEIADRELTAGGEQIDRKALRIIADDTMQSGSARRLALDLLDRLEPGTMRGFLQSQLNDVEFAADAVAETLLSATEMKDRGDSKGAVTLLKSAFQATVEPEQVRTVAAKLKDLGESVDVVSHLGTVTHWRIIGPFPGRNMLAVTEAFPPEAELDLKAQYDGKLGPISWKTVEQSAIDEWLDFKKLLAETDDAVAYAAAVVMSEGEREVELRAGADDNLQLWLNGKRVLSSPSFYQRPRTDRHRVKVRLKAGENTLLAKVCEVKLPPGPPSGGPARWQFGLRVVDEKGRGIPLATKP